MFGSSAKTKRLRELVEEPRTVVGIGGCLPIHAIMVERAGFELMHVGGEMVAAWTTGWGDVGALTMTEVVENARRITKVVDIPVLCDADTGYGNAVNVWRTTQEFIHAGAAGIMLEDQVVPKKAGWSNARQILDDEEAVGKFRAAAAARAEL